MRKAKIFDKTREDYLAQIGGIDLLSRADVLGATSDDGTLIIPIYGMPHRISKEGVFNSSGEKANFAVSVVLCCYILQCPEAAPALGDWVTYREFRDSAPLTSYFASNTNKIIETTFAGQLSKLENACKNIGGRIVGTPSFDFAATFDFLPRISVYFRFNDRDEEFPAQSSILFRRSAEDYLDMECLAIGGTYLTGLLINDRQGVTAVTPQPKHI
jgi:hypothetical protein